MKYLLIFLLIVGYSNCYEDLVIERRPHHVDWEDLFMEYNRYSAPNTQRMQVNVSIEIIEMGEGRILLELNQKWNDERLRFVGSVRVPVPSHIQPWTPDTYLRNVANVIVEQKSLSLNYDGSFLLREKYDISIIYRSDNKIDIKLASLNNYGTNIINYKLDEWKLNHGLDKDYTIISQNEPRKFDQLHFQDLIISIATHKKPVIHQFVDDEPSSPPSTVSTPSTVSPSSSTSPTPSLLNTTVV